MSDAVSDHVSTLRQIDARERLRILPPRSASHKRPPTPNNAAQNAVTIDLMPSISQSLVTWLQVCQDGAFRRFGLS